MAKKTVTEVLEIEAGAVMNALRDAGWPIGTVDGEKAMVLDIDGTAICESGKFGGFRFKYTREEPVVLRAAEK